MSKQIIEKLIKAGFTAEEALTLITPKEVQIEPKVVEIKKTVKEDQKPSIVETPVKTEQSKSEIELLKEQIAKGEAERKVLDAKLKAVDAIRVDTHREPTDLDKAREAAEKRLSS